MTECVNLVRIQETSDGDLEFEQELIEMYIEDAREHLDALKAQIAERDVEQVRRSAHTLKGSSSNIGATKMQDMSYQMEVLARDAGLSGAADHLEKMNKALEETEAFYNKYLESAT